MTRSRTFGARIASAAFATLFVLVLNAPASSAATPVAPPTCKAPAVPDQFKDDAAQNAFAEAAKAYEACILAYVKDRQDAAKANSEAGNKAADSFNKFAADAARARSAPQQ